MYVNITYQNTKNWHINFDTGKAYISNSFI